MNPQRVALDLDESGHETFPVFDALRGLAMVHQLPKTQRVHQIQRRDGRILVFVQLSADDGEAWRKALAAPAFEGHRQPLGMQYTTERFWFGATVRLSYSVAVEHA